MRSWYIILMLAFLLLLNYYSYSQADNLNVLLMNSTFKLVGDGKVGTVFILGRPQHVNPKIGEYVLITAAHVLDTIKSDSATIYFRQHTDNGYVRLTDRIPIREKGIPLWVKHPTVDVAALLVAIPVIARFKLLSIDYLATDSLLKALEISPGDELNCLGYPFGAEANATGFPILRSGKIASYPLIPVRTTKSFLLDFQVFGGNSGGPVYYYSPATRLVAGGLAQPAQFIAGVVIEQQFINETTEGAFEKRVVSYPLGLANVVHAQFILETIELLPK